MKNTILIAVSVGIVVIVASVLLYSNINKQKELDKNNFGTFTITKKDNFGTLIKRTYSYDKTADRFNLRISNSANPIGESYVKISKAEYLKAKAEYSKK